MRPFGLGLLIPILLAFVYGYSSLYAQETLVGTWVGMTTALGGSRFIIVRFEPQADTLTGSLDVPSADVMRLPMYNIARQGSSVRWRVHSPIGEFRLEGQMRDNVIEGTVYNNLEKAEKFHAVRYTALSEQVLSAYMGLYRFSNGQYAHIVPNALGQCTCIVFEQADSITVLSRTVTLIPSSEQTFFTSKSAIAPPAEPDETVSFERNAQGNVHQLVWKQPNGSQQTALKLDTDYKYELVNFINTAKNNEPIHLGGLLLTPKSIGMPYPAIVLAHGAGPGMRDNPTLFLRAVEFVKMGYAVLLYDKRGTGHPDGAYFRTSSYSDYAADALAAVAYLQKRSDIDARTIGIQGNSEAGWTIPLALAADTPRSIAFAIVGSGGGFTCEESELQEVRTLPRARYSDADISEAEQFVRAKWRYALTAQNWEEYQILYTRFSGKAWFQLINGPASKDSRLWQESGLYDVGDKRAISALEKISVPTLLLYGNPEKDTKCPVVQSRSAWEQAFKTSGHTQFRISTFDKSGHAVFLRNEGGKTIITREAFEAVQQWLSATMNKR